MVDPVISGADSVGAQRLSLDGRRDLLFSYAPEVVSGAFSAKRGVKMNTKTRYIVKVGMLSAIAFILMYIDFPLPIFPAWLKIDISDVPALLGALALGPFAGALIEVVKNLLYLVLKGTSSGGVGELANCLIGIALILPAAILYKRNKTRKTALIGILIGIALMSGVGAVINAYVLLPLYAQIMPLEVIMGMAQAVNPNLKTFGDIALYAVVPFNLLKGALVLLVTMLLYKRVSPILHK